MTNRPIILVVEDHRETRIFLELALGEKYIVDTAISGTKAIEKAEQQSYDLLLVDIALRDSIDGIEVAKRLRKSQGYEQTPMIAMTAHQFREERRFYLENGFDEYVEKPFFPQDLLDIIEELLAKRSDDGGDSARPGL